MFDPIQGPANIYQGPAVGLGTEAGDTWHAAVAKINAGFKNVTAAMKGGYQHIVEIVDGEARKDIADLREELAALQIKFDAGRLVTFEQQQQELGLAPTGIEQAPKVGDPNADPFAPQAASIPAAPYPYMPPPDTPAPAPDANTASGPITLNTGSFVAPPPAPPQEPQT